MDYLFLTTDGPDDERSQLVVEDFNAANEQNDYEVRLSPLAYTGKKYDQN